MTTSIVIRCKDEDEGPCYIEVNGEILCTTSYDADGSNGMRKIIQLARDLGEAFGVEVYEARL